MNARARAPAANDVSWAALVTDAFAPAQLERLAHADDWPDPPDASPALPRDLWSRALGDPVRDVLSRPGRRFRAHLTGLAFRLGGGVGDPPWALGAVIEIIHAGSLVIDDIEDGSTTRRGAPALHVRYGVPLALNAGNWMYFWALALVEELEPRPLVRERLHRIIVDAMARCHLGQALDLGVDVSRLPRAAVYRTVATSTSLKTGALMELAARMGAIVAGAPSEREEALARFGRRLGLGLQMLDDLGNLSTRPEAGGAAKALEDLRNGTPTWPWALAAQALDEAMFAELQVAARAAREGCDADDGRLRALAAALRMAVGRQGKQQAMRYLADALAQLHTVVGPRTELTIVAAEIQRVEAAYG